MTKHTALSQDTVRLENAGSISRNRIESVDILRGLVMVIMAIDHVREFWSAAPFRPEDLSKTTTAVFLTRWITHFCAPVFVFLSGISIFFLSQKFQSPKLLSRFLVKRGLWLILLQVVVISFFMQFSYNLVILEVIWVIGWSMILMSFITRLPRKWIAISAIGIIALHNFIPTFQQITAGNFLIAVLHNTPTALPIPGGPVVIIAYTIFPWAAVMAAGYVAGHWFNEESETRNRKFRITGFVATILFILLRLINVYGDPQPWSNQERGQWFSLLSFINTSKYPPSLLFLLMTLGPALILLSYAEKLTGGFIRILKVFGAVPFFFYLLHIPLIVLGSYAWLAIEFGEVVNLGFASPDQFPADYHYSMLRVFIVWLVYLVILYFLCRWYANYKRTHKDWWLSYL